MSPDETIPDALVSAPRELRFADGTQDHAALLLERGTARTILALPDWRGCRTDYALRRGLELAHTLDANVVVGDLYGARYRPVAYAGDAEPWVRSALADPLGLRPRLSSYVAALTRELGIGTDGLVAVGYCLGGALAFEMGRADLGLSAVVGIHGVPASAAPISRLHSPTRFLAIHGASDPIIGPDALRRFEAEMTAAGIDWTSIALGHARHGFTDEGADPNGSHQRFDPSAARRTRAFIAAFLAQERPS